MLGRALFEVGHVLHHLLEVDVSGGDRYLGEDAQAAERIIELFKWRMKVAKSALDCWTLVGRRLRVVKDTRKMIGQKMWDQRWEWGTWGKDEVPPPPPPEKRFKK